VGGLAQWRCDTPGPSVLPAVDQPSVWKLAPKRFSAAAVSTRTKSAGSSKRRCPEASFAVSQPLPIRDRNTPHEDKLCSIAFRKSLPGCGNVHKHRIRTELGNQVVVEPAGLALGVISPVTDEDRVHRVALSKVFPARENYSKRPYLASECFAIAGLRILQKNSLLAVFYAGSMGCR
jgi:hypothetical protein